MTSNLWRRVKVQVSIIFFDDTLISEKKTAKDENRCFF